MVARGDGDVGDGPRGGEAGSDPGRRRQCAGHLTVARPPATAIASRPGCCFTNRSMSGDTVDGSAGVDGWPPAS